MCLIDIDNNSTSRRIGHISRTEVYLGILIVLDVSRQITIKEGRTCRCMLYVIFILIYIYFIDFSVGRILFVDIWQGD